MSLPIDERVALTDRLLESLPAGTSNLTADLRAELDRRWAEHEANPNDVVSWDEVHAAVLARIK